MGTCKLSSPSVTQKANFPIKMEENCESPSPQSEPLINIGGYTKIIQNRSGSFSYP